MIISGIDNCKVMGSIKRWFASSILPYILEFILSCFLLLLPVWFVLNTIKFVLEKDYKEIYIEVAVLLLCFGAICGAIVLVRHKFILKNNINTADNVFTNITSMIPSLDEMVLLENKALAYIEGFKGTLSSRFNCAIHLVACGSIPERFAVPLMEDWIGDIGEEWIRHALLSDQDFLIEPAGITASYSATQSDTLEIVQSDSFIEEGFAKLRISRSMAGRFEPKEGFLSTDTIKHSVKRCISETPWTHFLGKINFCDSLGIMISSKIHGPAINVHIRRLYFVSVYLADFTFAIPCFKWPPESDWPFRNKIWPDHKVVTTIMNLGFHFVPKNQENDKLKLTWRYSFSLAERELSKHVNETARKSFLCLKIISADHLKPICKRLKSYHLKTILFRSLEVTPAKMWCEKNILNCFDYLLKELQEAFQEQRCIHFWISRINLFQDFNNCRLSKLKVRVEEIRKNPVPFLLKYSFMFKRSCIPFTKNDKELSCFCFGFCRDDWFMKLQIKNGRIRNSMSEEAAVEEGNHVRISIEEPILNVDSYPVRS